MDGLEKLCLCCCLASHCLVFFSFLFVLQWKYVMAFLYWVFLVPFGSNCSKLPSRGANQEKQTGSTANHACFIPDTSQPFQQNTFALWLVHVCMHVSLTRKQLTLAIPQPINKRSHLERCHQRHRPLQET